MKKNKKSIISAIDKDNLKQVEMGLILSSILVLGAFLILMITMPEVTIKGIGAIFWKVIAILGPIFEVFTFLTFLFAIYITFSKYGKIRLGESKPEYSMSSYIFMMLLASLASAALYWSFTEWAFYYKAPGLGIKPLSTNALESSLSFQFFHWGITNQAMYTVMGVAIGYGVYVRKCKSFQTSAICCSMMGEGTRGKSFLGKCIDFCVIFGILGGLSSSLGLVVPLAQGGLYQLFGIESTNFVKIGIIVVIALVYTFTSYLGTHKGMRVISNGTAYICIAFLLYVLAFGPTSFILKNVVNTLGIMVDKMVRMSLNTDPIRNTGFPENWTIYFQAFYLNYLAMMGIFVAKVSKGRTIREVGIATMLGISAGSWFLFGINGSFSISSHLTGKVDVLGLIESGKGDGVIYEILKVLPLGATLLPALMLILVVGFVASSMDSASLALAETVTKVGEPRLSMRLFWCILLAIIPMSIILTDSGFDAIKQIAILISIPFVLITIYMEFGLYRWLKVHDKKYH